MADWTFTRASQLAPKARQRVRVTVTAAAQGGHSNPRNHEYEGGQYYEMFVRSGDVWTRRSDSATPPFAWETQVTSSGTASYPWLYVMPRGEAVLFYEDAGDVYRTISYDEALSWETPAVAIAGGSKPFAAVNPFDGSELIAAFIVASGKISAQQRNPGELSYGAAFFLQDSTATDLLFENDTFSFHWGHETPNRLVLHALIQGEAATSTWASADYGLTWERFT